MDDQAVTKTYGKTNLPAGTPDRPLVTFALFAYNQEKYIREAVEGAFSQTYSPLEIILSDDCSSDQTFKIMEEMARDYQGPHLVKCRKSPKNEGILKHVMSVMAEINGLFVVVAAGDDVSRPNRTEVLTRTWIKTGAWGFFSDFDLINETSATILRSSSAKGNREIMSWFKSLGEIPFIHGATAAYDARLFGFVPKIESRVMAEDGLFYGLIRLLGRSIERVPKSLVGYRQHNEAIANNAEDTCFSLSCIEAKELKLENFASTYVQISKLLERSARDNTEMQARFEQVVVDIMSARARFVMRSAWTRMAVLNRVKLLILTRDKRAVNFILPRIFGLRVFCVCKFIYVNLK